MMSEPVLPADRLWDGCGSNAIASPVEHSTDINPHERRPIWPPDAIIRINSAWKPERDAISDTEGVPA